LLRPKRRLSANATIDQEKHIMNISRRNTLKALSAGALASGLNGFTLPFAHAQSAPSDYKALVCIFLFGGNDGNNMIIPADAAGYAGYSAIRSVDSGINIAQSELLTFKPSNTSATYGFHPSLSAIHPLFGQGKLAILANAGPLLAPTSKAQYQAGMNRPDQLFSHSDQQAQWQSGISDQPSRTGWGGRLADAVLPLNGSNTFPVLTSVAGSALYTTGNKQSPLAIPSSGSFGLTGLTGTDAMTRARATALSSLLQEGKDHLLVKAAAEQTEQAIALSAKVNPIITSTTSSVANLFTTTGNSLATQLLQVAKLIEARATIGLSRQIFFVSLGGFDTHNNQITTQQTLLGYVGAAMKSFYDATVALGVANNVTTFTLSDFGRTFKPAAGGGSDHAWGNHHMVMGGAVKGGTMYGSFPEHRLGGADDVSSEGRWLPTTSVDQYAATLASWFGVPASGLATVAPNIGAFANKNLGFV
jgi:uncharacterized protein (DUF1501 family)